ncbi:hypothetical protein B0H19DRAFT_1367861 [Mycena capillaripes]|nr:hypothetical protein B0H19DRAFT_1367861 [Mycena capillaripes]
MHMHMHRPRLSLCASEARAIAVVGVADEDEEVEKDEARAGLLERIARVPFAASSSHTASTLATNTRSTTGTTSSPNPSPGTGQGKQLSAASLALLAPEPKRGVRLPGWHRDRRRGTVTMWKLRHRMPMAVTSVGVIAKQVLKREGCGCNVSHVEGHCSWRHRRTLEKVLRAAWPARRRSGWEDVQGAEKDAGIGKAARGVALGRAARSRTRYAGVSTRSSPPSSRATPPYPRCSSRVRTACYYFAIGLTLAVILLPFAALDSIAARTDLALLPYAPRRRPHYTPRPPLRKPLSLYPSAPPFPTSARTMRPDAHPCAWEMGWDGWGDAGDVLTALHAPRHFAASHFQSYNYNFFRSEVSRDKRLPELPLGDDDESVLEAGNVDGGLSRDDAAM